MDAYLWSVATAVPPHVVTATETARVGKTLFPDVDAALFEKIVASTRTERRHVVRPVEEIVAARTVDEASRLHLEACVELAERALRSAIERAGIRATDIDALVLATSTAFAIPSIDAYVINRVGLRQDVRRLPYTSLGCAGGAGGLTRAAEAVTARGADATVAFIAVEATSLTFRRADLSMANVISATLFGDGAAAVVLRGTPPAKRACLRVRGAASWLHRDSYETMGFRAMPDGYQIVLAPDVPEMAARELPNLVAKLTREARATPRDLRFHVLHPGGRKVLERVSAALELGERDTAAAWRVLREYGNMSSPTVLFVLEETLRAAPPALGTLGLLAAFGPGFAAELALLEVVSA